MTHLVRRLGALTAATFALALLFIVATASANRTSISSQTLRGFGTFEFKNTVNTEVVRCSITLEGSVHSSTIAKTTGLLVGYVNRASVSACTGGSVTIHQESLPWHVPYEGFTGVLPNIREARYELLGLFLEIHTSGNTCSARTEAEHPAAAIVNLNTTTHVAESLTLEIQRIPLTNGAGGIFCGLAQGYGEGTTNALTVQGSTAKITVLLI